MLFQEAKRWQSIPFSQMLLIDLPYGLMILFIVLVEGLQITARWGQSLWYGLLGLLLLGTLLAWRRSWPVWGANWYSYLLFVALIIWPSFLLDQETETGRLVANLTIEVILPLLVLGVLFALLRWRLRQGLLVMLPLLHMTWSLYLEFVPQFYTTLVTVTTLLLLALAALLITRLATLGRLVWLLIGLDFLIGLLYVTAGHFLTRVPVRPGTVRAMVDDLLPNLLMGLAPAVGLLLLNQLATLSRSGGKRGRRGFRLVMAGLVVGLLVTLLLTRPILPAEASPWLGGLVAVAGLVCLVGAVSVGQVVVPQRSRFEVWVLLLLVVIALPLLHLPQTILFLRHVWQIAPNPQPFNGSNLGLLWLLAAVGLLSRSDLDPDQTGIKETL